MSGAAYSLRTRMIAATVACTLGIFGGIGLGAHAVARHESEELFSARLATSARVLEALVARQLGSATIERPIVIALPPELESTTSDEPQSFGHRYETRVAFQVWSGEGKLLARSASAPAARLGELVAGFSAHERQGTLWQVFALQSGKVWILMAENDDVRQELAHKIGLSILAPLAIGGVLMLLAINLILRRNMGVLRDLAGRIAAREPESLARIDMPATPSELAPIVTELNHLLERIRAAFEREQHFINAAAHEIRTPIAGLQLHVENAVRAQSQPERDDSLASAMAAVRRISSLAEQLLVLGRISAGGGTGDPQPVPLMALCCEVIGAVEPLLARRGQNIGLDVQADSVVRGQRDQLGRLLQNLIDNASVHGAPGAEIQVTLLRRGQDAVLCVANDGVPIPPAELERIFTPYYRLPGRTGAGHGLGLAIVKEIASQHHATIAIHRRADGQGTVVEVALPALDEPGGQQPVSASQELA